MGQGEGRGENCLGVGRRRRGKEGEGMCSTLSKGSRYRRGSVASDEMGWHLEAVTLPPCRTGTGSFYFYVILIFELYKCILIHKKK